MAFVLTACGSEKENSSEPTISLTAIITELTVWGMSCSRCVNSITSTVSAMDGVIDVSVDLRAEKVTVTHTPELDIALVKSAITGEGFQIP